MYQLKEDRLNPGPSFDVKIDGKTTVVSEAIGAPCPALIFPNHDDWASVAAIAAALETGNFNTTTKLFLREAHQADAECLDLRIGLAQVSKDN